MATVLEIFDGFVNGQLATAGTSPLPPDPNTLGDYKPDLSTLLRDADDIIMRWQASCGEIPGPDADGGDSAHRVGSAAFCNSAVDKGLLPKFEDGHGIMLRHPTQVPWNKSNNCTLDQLKGYSVGCWRAGLTDITKRLLEQHALRNWKCQNLYAPDRCPVRRHPEKLPDGLQPHEIMSLRISAGDNQAYLDPVMQFWMYASIQITDIGAAADNPNLIFESILCGRLNVFVAAHPNYKDLLRNYWNSNQQAPLAEVIIDVVEQELKRYPKTMLPLLPENQLNFLKSVNLSDELKNIEPGHRSQMAEHFAEAALRDAAGLFNHMLDNTIENTIKQLKSLSPEATADQIVKSLNDAKSGKPADVIGAGLSAAGFAQDQVNHAVQAVEPLLMPGPPDLRPPIPPVFPVDPRKVDPKKLLDQAKKALDVKKIWPKLPKWP